MSYTLLLKLRRDRVLCLACSVVATMFVLGIVAGAAGAQTVDPSMWSTDGAVNAIALSGNTIYLGGYFKRVGPITGHYVGIDVGTGLSEPGWPRVEGGRVWRSAADGAGGWYIGGDFTSVSGVARNGLAHIRADKTLDAWDPGADGQVLSLVVSGSTVYVGGLFTSIGGQSRTYFAALDGTTGLATAWNPNSDGGVYAIAVSGSTVYAGGWFTSIGGQSRSNIAALDVATGLATAWDPNADYGVGVLIVSGSIVYAAGGFTNIGGQNRNFIGALDATTGLATAWDPSAQGGWVYGMALSGSTMYAGGDFSDIGGQSHRYLAALDVTTGLATEWFPGPDSQVETVVVSGSTVYAGGYFTRIGAQSRSNVAAIDAGTGLATAWDPSPNAGAYAISVSGSTVYVGGDFTRIGGQSRSNLAALDATTGQATAWNPGANNGVQSLAVNGSTVYAGGAFSSIGGQSRTRIAALDATTGLTTAWNPRANGGVLTLAVSGTTVYAGGLFTSTGGQSRSHIAALDATTGLATAWNPAAIGDLVSVRTLAVSGSTVYAGGSFTAIGGQSRSNIAALDATTGLATAWNPNADGSVTALAVSGSTVYAGGDNFWNIGGQNRANIAALDATTGLATAWNPGADNGVRAMAVSGSTVYAGGIFHSIGGQSRNCIAGLDAATGLATEWDPVLGVVSSLAVSGLTLNVGGSFSGGYAAVSIPDTPVPTLLARFEAEQTSTGVQLRWQFGEPGRVVDVALERAPNHDGPWVALAFETQRMGDAMEAFDATVTSGETYYYRLTANLTDGTHVMFGPISAEAVMAVKVSGLTGIAPNPTSNSARIDFALARQEKVRISVVDVTGREAAVLADGPMAPGSYSMVWDGRKDGARLPAGVYYVRWASAERSMSRKLVVMP